MKLEWKALWIAALRSGEYKQGQGKLIVPAGQPAPNDSHAVDFKRHCCLGVLCAISGVPFDGYDGGVPHEIAVLTGFPWQDQTQAVLIDMNDTKGNSFEEIADYIEKKL